jgi:hypothetical protein
LEPRALGIAVVHGAGSLNRFEHPVLFSIRLGISYILCYGQRYHATRDGLLFEPHNPSFYPLLGLGRSSIAIFGGNPNAISPVF